MSAGLELWARLADECSVLGFYGDQLCHHTIRPCKQMGPSIVTCTNIGHRLNKRFRFCTPASTRVFGVVLSPEIK